MPENGSRSELSDREHEILRLVATGASNKEIGRQLAISPNTVKVHLRNIFAKIGSASRTEATLYAIRAGLVAVPVDPADIALAPAAVPTAAPAGQAEPRPTEIAATGGLPRRAVTGDPGQRAWRYIAVIGAVLVIIALGSLWAARQPRPIAGATNLPATPTTFPPLVRWTKKAPLPTARSGLAVAVYENMVYAIAGETDETVTGSVERYNPDADQWATLTAKPIAVADVSAAVIGGLIYVPGGRLQSGQLTQQVEAYDPRRDKWMERAPLPLALSGYALAVFEGKLYLFGGWDGTGYVARSFEYSPDADQWVEKTSMPSARGFGGAAAASGRIYVIGGENGREALGLNEAYTPEQDTPGSNPWQTFPPLPAGRSHMGVASVAGIIHILGGEPGDQPLTYDDRSGAWLPLPLPETKLATDAGVAVVGSQIEVLGGKLAARPSGQHLRYQAIYVITLPWELFSGRANMLG